MAGAETIVDQVRETFSLPVQDIRTYSPLALAYIGDSIYDLVIRTMLVERGNSQAGKLHRRASALVKAPTQREIMEIIRPVLTEEETGYYKRGRNAKSFTSAKNATITEYRIATGFEALLGFLYLTNQMGRILELVKLGTGSLAGPGAVPPSGRQAGKAAGPAGSAGCRGTRQDGPAGNGTVQDAPAGNMQDRDGMEG